MPASACNTNYIVVRLHIYCIIAGMDIMGTSSGSLSPTTSGSASDQSGIPLHTLTL